MTDNRTVQYAYDGEGRRIEKMEGTTSITRTFYIYDLAGRLLSEYGASGSLSSPAEQVCSGSGTTKYYHDDHLGSVRVITGFDGQVITGGRRDYYPFGEEITPTPDNQLKFTGKLRDDESRLDYFGARYYASSLGRFLIPDDVHNDTYPGDPQSWNRYAYARNNPLRFIDPRGDAVVAYDQSGNVLCRDLECEFGENGTLIVGDKTYAANQFRLDDPNPSAIASAPFEPVPLLNRFGLPLAQYGDYHGPPEPGLVSLTPELANLMMAGVGIGKNILEVGFKEAAKSILLNRARGVAGETV